MKRIPRPTRRTIVVVLVISSVLLAGCSGLIGDDSSVEDNETNETGEVNTTTNESIGPNETTNTSEEADNTTDTNQTDTSNAGDSDEMNDSDPDTDASPAPENETETTDTNQTNDTDEAEEPEGATDETNETDDTDEPTETTETDTDTQTDDAEDTEEYAGPNDFRIEGVTHMESDADLERDQVTVTNTNDELALPIGGWEIAFEGTDQRVTIEEGTVIEPGESQTIPLGDGEKVLSEDGGVAHVYDADGNHVGSWDHIGSPSSPPESSGADEVGYVQFEIVDAESGESVEDADVALEGGNEQLTGSTDGAGVTTIREIPYGEYELTVDHDEYASHSETITVDEEGTEMTIELESSDSEATALQTGTAGTVSTSA